jgi:EAL and modified HD-GYP domain-containing signal transduction protein
MSGFPELRAWYRYRDRRVRGWSDDALGDLVAVERPGAEQRRNRPSFRVRKGRGMAGCMGEDYVHIGRQPIFDTAGAVVGYELLFRAGSSATSAGVVDGDDATAQVIVNTFTQFGLHALVGSGMAFINLTRPFITGELLPPFEPGRVVLEILEDIPADAEVYAGCERLAAQGYRIALDDLAPGDQRMALLPLASFAKLDFLQCTAAELREIARDCLAAGVELIAEKVDSRAAMETARALGCTLFQGHHLARAQVLSSPT